MDDYRRAELIIAAVARMGGVKEAALRGRKTPPTLCKLRDTARFLIRHQTELSLPEIGKLFGGQDHTTVLAAVRREQLRLERNAPQRQRPRPLTYAEWHAQILAEVAQDTAEAAGDAAAPKE